MYKSKIKRNIKNAIILYNKELLEIYNIFSCYHICLRSSFSLFKSTSIHRIRENPKAIMPAIIKPFIIDPDLCSPSTTNSDRIIPNMNEEIYPPASKVPVEVASPTGYTISQPNSMHVVTAGLIAKATKPHNETNIPNFSRYNEKVIPITDITAIHMYELITNLNFLYLRTKRIDITKLMIDRAVELADIKLTSFDVNPNGLRKLSIFT